MECQKNQNGIQIKCWYFINLLQQYAADMPIIILSSFGKKIVNLTLLIFFITVLLSHAHIIMLLSMCHLSCEYVHPTRSSFSYIIRKLRLDSWTPSTVTKFKRHQVVNKNSDWDVNNSPLQRRHRWSYAFCQSSICRSCVFSARSKSFVMDGIG